MRINSSRLQWSINHESLSVFLVRREYEENGLFGYLDAHNWSENYEYEYKSLLHNHPFATYCSFYGGRPKLFDPAHLVLQFFEFWGKEPGCAKYTTNELGIIERLLTYLPRSRWEVKSTSDPVIECVYSPLIAVESYVVDGKSIQKAGRILNLMGTADCSAGFIQIDVLEALR